MNKKLGIGLCIAGLILCFVGVAMIAFNAGRMKGNKNDVVDSTSSQVVENTTGNSGDNTTDKNSDKNNDSTDKNGAGNSGNTDANTDSNNTDNKDNATGNTNNDNNNSDNKDNSNNNNTGDKVLLSSDVAAPSVCGALAVNGSTLVDQKGNPVQLRGISTHGLSWFPTFVNQEAFKQFRQEWNVNVMRLAMYTYESGGYCSDGNKEDLKNIIYRGVQYATDYDMYVIIDWHVLQDQDPNKFKDEAKQFFDDMSKKYKDSNNILYEICNEPNGGVTWSQIKSYAEEIIPVIRANDPDAIILVGTPNWSQRVDEAAADPITGYDNIMYTLHFYAGTHKDDLRNTLSKAVDGGLPVFVSEYGICDASGNGALDKDSAKKWVDLMNEKGISYVCWALANKNESAALIKSSSNKTCQFGPEDLSESGKWLYETLTGETVTVVGNSGVKEEKTDVEAGDGIEFQSGGLEGWISLKSKWEADGKTNYQYDLTLKNPGDQNLNSWAIDIHFSNEVEIDNSWNGNFTVNGKTVHITNVDHNAKIKAGDSIRDMGFVLVAPAGTVITD